MKSVQVRTRGEGGSEIGDFTAYVLYGCPLKTVNLKIIKMQTCKSDTVTIDQAYAKKLAYTVMQD